MSMAKRKRAKKQEPEEEPESRDLKENLKTSLKTFFDRYGFLAAFGGAVPLISGFLLFQDKECGCFLLPHDTLRANNEFFGALSIVAGLALVLPAIIQYTEKGKRKKKVLKIRYEYIVAFILAVGLAKFYIDLDIKPPVEVKGDYDELTLKLAESGWVMFYANWCEACHQQFDLLGTSAKNLRLVDCDTVTCPDIVKGYPTWAKTRPDGGLEVREGAQTIESLQQMAGLEVP
jgi:thiol-disulfide isomerase/thioredoxin